MNKEEKHYILDDKVTIIIIRLEICLQIKQS